MAWRDSRRNRSRLLLFISSIILGIGALVAINSLSDTLQEEIDEQAANLLGADIELSSGKLVTAEVKKVEATKLASLDVAYRVTLITDDSTVLALGALDGDTMLKVSMEVEE